MYIYLSRILLIAVISFILASCSNLFYGPVEDEASFLEAPDLELITVFGSTSLSKSYEQIQILGDYAYLLLNDQSQVQEVNFMILDVSDPTTPQSVSQRDVIYTPYTPTGMAITENYAFITRNDFGVEVIDISDKANPVSTDIYENIVAQYTSPTKVIAINNYVYYFDGVSNWHILDVSNPREVQLVKKFRGVGEPMVVIDNYIYAIKNSDQTNNSTLQIVDVSNPKEPILVSERLQFWLISDIAIWRDRAYLLSSADRTYILDISQPMQPDLVAIINQGGSAITTTNGIAYIVTDNGLMALDISDEAGGSPNYIATIGEEKLRDLLQTKGVTYSENADGTLRLYTHIGMKDVAIANDHVFVMDSSQGMMVFKLPD